MMPKPKDFETFFEDNPEFLEGVKRYILKCEDETEIAELKERHNLKG